MGISLHTPTDPLAKLLSSNQLNKLHRLSKVRSLRRGTCRGWEDEGPPRSTVVAPVVVYTTACDPRRSAPLASSWRLSGFRRARLGPPPLSTGIVDYRMHPDLEVNLFRPEPPARS